ncbi:AAA family ATPase [Sorangium sp. So ce448]|uniref:serine/threonine-protein kinase n=1 Tax=Sorangium sp. So ce448 TaxID=3133314 RepID=UPI003F626FAF
MISEAPSPAAEPGWACLRAERRLSIQMRRIFSRIAQRSPSHPPGERRPLPAGTCLALSRSQDVRRGLQARRVGGRASGTANGVPSAPVATPEQLANACPTQIGPYRVVHLVGHGGMGVVFEGEHVETGEPVAIKTVFTPAESSLSSIRREIHALQRIRHPGVVKILQQGVDGGLPWYSMELLRGRTFRDHIGDIWRRHAGTSDITLRDPEQTIPRNHDNWSSPQRVPVARCRTPPIQSTLSLMRMLCRTLAFLHGNGVVHRDLKPENVFIRLDSTPVLVDFGIAARFGGAKGRETLELAALAGTASYMAPEQISGELVDARADLYAVGCMLFECVTGSPPFQDPQPHMVLRRHLYEPAPSPSLLVDGVPPQLEDVILRLLEKSPQDRLGHADDLAAILGDLGACDWDTPPMPAPQPYLYRPTFSGRGEALREIEGALSRVNMRQGACVFVGGESGIGKTRLAMEASAVAQRRGFLVITGECVAVAAEAGKDSEVRAGPLHPFRSLLIAVADRCRALGAAGAERLLGAAGKVLASYEPALLSVPCVATQADPPALHPDAARKRVLDGLAQALFALAQNDRLLMIIDDLQWADDLSIAFVQQLAETSMEGRSMVVLCTYRMEELSPEIAGLVRTAGVRSFMLSRLDDVGVSAMVSGMLALRPPPRSLVEFLVTSSDGNPFFVAEYLRTAIGEGLLTRDRAGRWRLHERAEEDATLRASMRFPRTLADLVDRRLGAIGEEARSLVELASVLGREFDSEQLAATSKLDDTVLLEALEVLRVRHVIEEAALGRLRFAHDKIREVAYERIPEERRCLLHRRVADVLTARWPGAPDLDATLAHHFAKARAPERASIYFARAGDRARAAHANGEAISFYRSAIAEAHSARAEGGGKSLEPEERLHENLGDLLAITGGQEEAKAAYASALRCLRTDDRLSRARLCRKVGKTCETHHRHDDALRSYALAEEALGPEPTSDGEEAWWHAWIHVKMERTWVHYWLAQVDELGALVERLRPVVERRGTSQQRAQFFQSLMHMDLRRERYVASAGTVTYARASMEASEESRDAGEICGARFALGFTLLFNGGLEEAEVELGAALREAERIGDVPLQSRCLTYLMMTFRKRCAVELTRSFAERTLAVATAGKMKDYVGAAQANLGWVAFRAGEITRAESLLLAAMETWRSLAYAYPFQWMALLPLLDIELGRDRLREAADLARAMLDPKQERLPDRLVAPLEGADGDAVARAGSAGAARALLAQAVDVAEQLRYL